jgi:Ca2+-binding EF-hand superfamily protein
MEHLTEEQIAQCRELFAALDLTGNGMLGVREVGVVLRALGMEVTESDVMDMVATAGTTGPDGAGVGFADFLRLVIVGPLGDRDPRTELEEAFKEMDEGTRDGKLTREDLMRTAERHGRTLTTTEADETMREGLAASGRGGKEVGGDGLTLDDLQRVMDDK